MEGSVAAAAPGQGAEGQVQGQQAGEGAQGADAQAQFDPASINDALSQLSSGQEQLYAFLQQQPWAQGAAAGDGAGAQEQDAAAAAAEGLDLSFLEDPQVAPEQVGSLLEQTIQQAVEARVNALVQPLSGQVSEMQQQQEAEALAREFADLQDPKVAEEVVGRAQQAAQLLGRPELGTNMQFVRLVYMAGRAADLQNEGAGAGAGTDAAHLEGAAGARPGGGAQGGLTTQEIVGANRRGSVLPFG